MHHPEVPGVKDEDHITKELTPVQFLLTTKRKLSLRELASYADKMRVVSVGSAAVSRFVRECASTLLLIY